MAVSAGPALSQACRISFLFSTALSLPAGVGLPAQGFACLPARLFGKNPVEVPRRCWSEHSPEPSDHLGIAFHRSEGRSKILVALILH